MIKAISAVLLSALLVVFLLGCGDEGQETVGQPEHPTAQESTTEQPEHPTSEESTPEQAEHPTSEGSTTEHPE